MTTRLKELVALKLTVGQVLWVEKTEPTADWVKRTTITLAPVGCARTYIEVGHVYSEREKLLRRG